MAPLKTAAAALYLLAGLSTFALAQSDDDQPCPSANGSTYTTDSVTYNIGCYQSFNLSDVLHTQTTNNLGECLNACAQYEQSTGSGVTACVGAVFGNPNNANYKNTCVLKQYNPTSLQYDDTLDSGYIQLEVRSSSSSITDTISSSSVSREALPHGFAGL